MNRSGNPVNAGKTTGKISLKSSFGEVLVLHGSVTLDVVEALPVALSSLIQAASNLAW